MRRRVQHSLEGKIGLPPAGRRFGLRRCCGKAAFPPNLCMAIVMTLAEAAQWKASSGLTGRAGSQVVESTSMAAPRVRWPSFGRHLFSNRSIHCCACPQLEAVGARPCPYHHSSSLSIFRILLQLIKKHNHRAGRGRVWPCRWSIVDSTTKGTQRVGLGNELSQEQGPVSHVPTQYGQGDSQDSRSLLQRQRDADESGARGGRHCALGARFKVQGQCLCA